MVANYRKQNGHENELTDGEESKTGVESDDPQSQLDKFKEAARQLETDDDEERFEEKLKKLVKKKVKPAPKGRE
ncbi:hypothetical protein [Roseovarius salinarum]|uniref:hypothetical protein n=1 Tax=Roseovarius salinarum TaxID=1981892 RepID=UPI001E658C67|nr:hypothetical protein [Roseovarius salinarum]